MSSMATSSIARYRPIILSVIGLTVCCSVYYAVTYNQKPPTPLHRSNAVHRRRNRPRSTTPENTRNHALDQDATPTGPANDIQRGHSLQDLSNQDGTETVAESEVLPARPSVLAHGGNLKELLYYIAEDQSRQNAYIHRGVMCNACYMKPIRGIRWRCATCADYDLCSECEALSTHSKTHIFYKVKIPAPFLGNPRHDSVIYPGKPEKMPPSLPKGICKKFGEETKFDKEEIDALYDQFTCLANEEWPEDPTDIGYGINRAAFDIAFIPLVSINPPQPNLLYDRIFEFYDSNGDGLIGFEEFLRGLAYVQNKSRDDSHKRKFVFNGFDIDGDGYISRQDILRVFRAYYAIQKDITHDLLAVQEEEFEIQHVRDSLYSRQPLSAIFTEPPPPHQSTFPVEEKAPNEFGDKRHADAVILNTSQDNVSREEIVANISGRDVRRNSSAMSFSSRNSDEAELNEENDGKVLDSRTKLRDRYRRRQFYTDEEEGCEIADPDREPPSSPALQSESTPLGLPRLAPIWNLGDGSDDEIEATPAVVQHTGSSTQAVHYGSREVLIPDQKTGKEILYQVVQEGLNELLNPIFKKKEKLDLEVENTRAERTKWHKEIVEFRREKDHRNQIESEEEAPNGAVVSVDPEMKVVPASFAKSEDAEESLSSSESSGPLSSAGNSDKSYTEELDSTSDVEVGTLNSAVDNSKDRDPVPDLVRDPTMPQFMPNSQADINRLRSTASFAASNEDAEVISDKGPPPSSERLERYVMLNEAEQEILKARGPGRISFEEFENTMNGDDGRQLAFAESWFELGSF